MNASLPAVLERRKSARNEYEASIQYENDGNRLTDL